MTKTRDSPTKKEHIVNTSYNSCTKNHYITRHELCALGLELAKISSALRTKLFYTIAEISFKSFNVHYLNELCGLKPPEFIINEQMRLELKHLTDYRTELEHQLHMCNNNMLQHKLYVIQFDKENK